MKRAVTGVLAFLAFLGRHGKLAFALSVLLGLALPQLAAAMRPILPVAIFCFIVSSFARANVAGVRQVAAAPARLAAALAFSVLVPPLAGGAAILALGPGLDPQIRLGIALMAAAPPLMASPVYAALLGFENSLALALLVLGMAVSPFTAPGLVNLLAGAAVPLDPLALGFRLVVFIGGGIACGLLIRRLAGTARVAARRHELDGLNVVLFFLFAIAAMDGVIDATLAQPWLMAGLLAIAIGQNVAGFLVTLPLARVIGRSDAFNLAIGVGLRNMGLLIAVLGAATPPLTFLYFALAQIPIYFAPLALGALPARRTARPGSAPDLPEAPR